GQVATLATNTLGYEWDEDLDNGARPAGLMRMSSTTVNAPQYLVDFGTTTAPATRTHALTLYKHASGALVFGAGTVQWAWGLDPKHDTSPDVGSSTADFNVQQATLNVLADMGAQPATRQINLYPAVPSTDVAPPASIVQSPNAGATVSVGSFVTISGTATDAGGGVVAGVEGTGDGGRTWHAATGRGERRFQWGP